MRARGGLPLPEAAVCALDGEQQDRASEQCVSTDRAGRFSLPAPAAAAPVLLASASGYEPRVLRPGWSPRSLAAGELIEIELEPGGAALAGQVIDATGGPVPGAAVTAGSGTGAGIESVAFARADGSFALSAGPGLLRLCAEAEAYSRACSEVTAPAEGQRLVLTAASTIVGRVVTTGGEPVADAWVSASNPNGARAPARSSQTDAAGGFSLGGLAAGGYEVVAVSPWGRSERRWVSLGTASMSDPLVLETSPAVPVSLRVLAGEEPCTEGMLTLSGPILAEARLTGTAEVTVAGVPPGSYEASADCAEAFSHTLRLEVGGAPVQSTLVLERVPTAAASPGELEQAPAGGTLRVTVVGTAPGGAAARVIAESLDGSQWLGRAHGSAFIVDGLLPGDYRVYADDDVEHARVARIARPGESVAIELQRPRYRAISGRVLGDDGEPVADAWVRHFRSDTLSGQLFAPHPVLSDEEGGFTLQAMPGAPYTISVASPRGDASMTEVVGDSVELRVSAPAALSGSVVAHDQRPVSEFALRYGLKGDSTSFDLRGARTGFSIPVLPPGTYALAVTSAHGSASREVALGPGEHATITLTLDESGAADSR